MGPQNQVAGRGSVSFRDAHTGLWRRKGKGGGHPRKQGKCSRRKTTGRAKVETERSGADKARGAGAQGTQEGTGQRL